MNTPPSRLLVECPSWSVICQVLKLLKLPTEFPVIFQQSDISLENSVWAAGILQPYYKPKMAEKYLAFTDQKRWITVLKHILGPHGYCITYKETTRDKQKAIIYSILKNSGTLLQPVEIGFE